MKKQKNAYAIITLLFIVISIVILKHTNLSDNVALSKSIQIILILFLMRIAYGCTIYIKVQYQKKKYSYGIVMNVGLLLFIIINIMRQINLLIENWNVLSINNIYNNTLESFSFFAMLTLPCIVILSVYSIITNIFLIKREVFSYKNLLGVFLGVFALMGLFGSQAIYSLTSSLLVGEELIVVKKIIDVTINVTLSYFYTLIIATLYCNIIAARHIPKYDKDYVIILGCMIKKDGTLTVLLKSRVDKAIEFAKKQKEITGKDIIFVPSGGQGDNEVMPEAEAMKNYLIEQGIKEENIIVENKSTSTLENMKFSKAIILNNKADAKISFATTNYHVFRSGIIANDCGMDCEGMGSKTNWYFYSNALIREFIANLVRERKKHIVLILLFIISALILVLIGHNYKLFNTETNNETEKTQIVSVRTDNSIDEVSKENGFLSSTHELNLRDIDGNETNYIFTYNNTEFTAKYTTNNWKIIDSYKITNENDMEIICKALIDIHPIPGKVLNSFRTVQDLVKEWEIHNISYALISENSKYKENVKDVDFNTEDQGKSLEDFIHSRIKE